MSARDEIFASIRRSLNVGPVDAPRRDAVAARLAHAPVGIVPRRGQGEAAERLATFKSEAERVQATVAEVAAAADVPAEIARYLRENNLPATLRFGDDARLADMPWAATALEIARGPSEGDDLNAVSAAFAAVAETGTLALVSGPDNPTTLNFLPDNHFVVVFAADVVADVESVFARLKAAYGRRRAAAHGQFHHRPVALGRHRADPAARRPWAAAAAYRCRRRRLASPPPNWPSWRFSNHPAAKKQDATGSLTMAFRRLLAGGLTGLALDLRGDGGVRRGRGRAGPGRRAQPGGDPDPGPHPRSRGAPAAQAQPGAAYSPGAPAATPARGPDSGRRRAGQAEEESRRRRRRSKPRCRTIPRRR